MKDDQNSYREQPQAHERLYRDATNRLENKFFNTINDGDHKPNISQKSGWISENSTMFNGNLKDFHARQEAFLQKQAEQRAEKERETYEKYSFKPQINLTSEIICESDPKRNNENGRDRIERLYQADQQRKEVIKEMKEQEMYGQYTFQP